MALVADSFHMLSDVVSLFVGYFALKISQQAHRHNVGKNTFGWVRAEVLGALVNSVFLVALCFSISVESLKRIVTPEGIKSPLLVLGIGAAGLLVNVLGIFIFQGHLGHGHSHGGHGHGGHGGHGHSHGKQSINGTGNELERTVENNQELTTVVIANKVISKEDQIDIEHGKDPADESRIELEEDLGELANNRVHTTPSRYKMGMMLAAIQAEGEASGLDVVIATSKTFQDVENSKKPKKVTSSDQMNIRGVYLHVLGDALGSVIVICSALAIYYGKGKWTLYVDPVMSIIMVAIILKSSVPLLKESSMILLQTVPTHIQIRELEEKLMGKFPSVVGVHEFHVWQLAGTKIVASLHLKLSSRGDYMTISESIKAFFHEEGIHSTTIQPEFVEEIRVSDRQSPCLLRCVDTTCKDSVCCLLKDDSSVPVISETEEQAASNSDTTEEVNISSATTTTSGKSD
eukprot:Seg930.4 transcript_id=Seg930.4/GoldUCD/mRNA.D3Y31 product="Zinc transporter 1" protein_id=Seg930.4/GoldUCD/D3Y31